MRFRRITIGSRRNEEKAERDLRLKISDFRLKIFKSEVLNLRPKIDIGVKK